MYYSTNICFAVRVKAPNDLKLSKIELIVYNKVDYTFRKLVNCTIPIWEIHSISYITIVVIV